MRRPHSITGRIRAMLEANPDRNAHQIAAKVGCTPHRVREMRWRIVNPERARAQGERLRRANGVRPAAEYRAVQAVRSAALAKAHARKMLARQHEMDIRKLTRATAVRTLRAEGLSFTDCARQLQTTKGIIAGIVYRAQRELGA